MHGEQQYQGQSNMGQAMDGPLGLAAARSGSAVPPRRVIVAGVVVVLIIVAAIIGHAVAGANSIAAGDCVVTNPNVLTGWDIKKVACGSNPGSALVVQQVVSVENGSNGQCDLGLTTFQDDPSGKTYCLSGYALGNGGCRALG